MFRKSIIKGCPVSGSLFIGLWFCLLLAGCTGLLPFKIVKFEQPWFVTSQPLAPGDSALKSAVFSFYDDGSFTRYDAKGYSWGSWEKVKNTQDIYLKPQGGEKNYWKIKTDGGGAMEVNIFKTDPGGIQLGLMQLKAAGANLRNDPFSTEENQWRKKPASPETLNQIKERVLQYMHFQETLLKYCISNKVQVMPTSWFATPIKMYFSNGVRMAYSNELEQWHGCFYDSAQAVKGYQFLSGAINKIELEASENRFERNLDCVEKMEQVIKTGDLLKESILGDEQ